MNALRRQLPACTWLAILAMLALALLPTVSRAMAHGTAQGSIWIEICTAQGIQFVALDDASGTPDAPAQAGSQLDHCPHCGLAAHAMGLPSVPLAVLDMAAATSLLPPLIVRAPRSHLAWCSAQPRAPPQEP